MLPDLSELERPTLLAELVRLALQEQVPEVQLTILRQIGLFTSKFIPSADVGLVTDLFSTTRAGLTDFNGDQAKRIRVLFWVARSLVLRLANTQAILQDLMGLLKVSSCSRVAARGFGLLLAPDEVVSKEHGAVIRLLAKQRVFSICVPTISEEFRQAEKTTKQNYLIALSGILKYVPTEVVLPEINSLLPLLLQSLDLQDLDVKTATLENLTLVVQESPQAIEEHIGSLISRLLKSVGDPKVNSASTRYSALRCLKILPGKVKEQSLLPYKTAVTRGLMVALDDPKRYIRKAAVDCRAAWFAMDEPASD